MGVRRSDFTRPISVAIAFTILGEVAILLAWGAWWFPGGLLWQKVVWTGTCGLAMGATIGALVNLVVTGRMDGAKSASAGGLIFFAIPAVCTVLCFEIDLETGSQFGAREAPALFVGGGIVLAFLGAVTYAWLLFTESGTNLLSRIWY